jgi:hypothetical protein
MKKLTPTEEQIMQVILGLPEGGFLKDILMDVLLMQYPSWWIKYKSRLKF